jgi:hypothetical protein
VPARRVGELLAAAVRQLGVRHAKIRVARCALDVPGVLQTLEQSRHAGRREQQAAREVDALQPLVGRRREHEQGLEVVDRQPVVGEERSAQLARRDGLGPQQHRERAHGRARLHEALGGDNCLIRQYLTPQSFLATLLAHSNST